MPFKQNMSFTKLHKLTFKLFFIKYAVQPSCLRKLALLLVITPTVTQTLTIYIT